MKNEDKNLLFLAAGLGFLLWAGSGKDDDKDNPPDRHASTPPPHKPVFTMPNQLRVDQESPTLSIVGPGGPGGIQVIDDSGAPPVFAILGRDGKRHDVWSHTKKTNTPNPVITDTKTLRRRIECCNDIGVGERPNSRKKQGEKMTAQEASRSTESDRALNRMTIVIDSWDDFYYFGDLLASSMYMYLQDPHDRNVPKARDIHLIGRTMFDWFAYHRWCLSSKMVDEMGKRAASYSCAVDSNIPKLKHPRTYPTWSGARSGTGCEKRGGLEVPPVRLPIPPNATPSQRAALYKKKRQIEEELIGFRFRETQAYPAFFDGRDRSWVNKDKVRQACWPRRPLFCLTQNQLQNPGLVAMFELGPEFVGWTDPMGRDIEPPKEGWDMGIDEAFGTRVYRTASWQKFEQAYNWGRQGKYYARLGPCGALIEYATARYMSLMFMSGINPAIGVQVGEIVTKSLVEAAGTITSVALTGNPVGIALGAVMEAAKLIFRFVQMAFQLNAVRDKTKKLRLRIGQKLDKLWEWGRVRHGLKGRYWGPEAASAVGFSGYRANIIIRPKEGWRAGCETNKHLCLDELVESEYFRYFAVAHAHQHHAFAQLPMYYLNINFGMAIGRDPAGDGILVLDPTENRAGYVSTLKDAAAITVMIERSYKQLGSTTGNKSSLACNGLECSRHT